MSDKLFRLGSFAFRKRRLVVMVWLLALAVSLVLMLNLRKPIDDSFSIPGTESQEALTTLKEKMPAVAGGSGRIVFAVADGEKDIIDFMPVINKSLANISQLDQVALVAGPSQTGAISADGKVAMAQVQLMVSLSEVSDELAPSINEALNEARASGLQAESGGDIIPRQPGKVLGLSEIAGVGIAALVLVITFGALAASGMPLATALIGVGLGISGIFIASAKIQINNVTPTLAVMLGLAVGIDYSLFIITRHRKYMMEGLTPTKAVPKAIATAGNAVVFAALVVIIALSALAVVGIPFIRVMGLAAAGTVAMVALIAITLVPALLGFAGYYILSPKQRRLLARGRREETPVQLKKSLAYRYGTMLVRKPVLPILLVVAVLLFAFQPIKDMKRGFPSDGSAPESSTQRKAYDLAASSFGPGVNGPLIVVADLPEGLNQMEVQQKIGSLLLGLKAVEGVAVAVPAGISQDASTAVFQIIPSTGPADSDTKDLVYRIREHAGPIAGDSSTIKVTGSTALLIDTDAKVSETIPEYILLVVGLSIILLLVVFRSIIIPIKATLGFLLSIGATFGALVAFFQWGWGGFFEPMPVVSFLPIIITGILFGLAMDYEFFLVSGMQESYSHENKGKPKEAVVNGYVYGSRVVVAAAAIMISVFAGFIFHDNQMIQMVGFTLAFGVFVDAFIVRLTLVPAVMSLAGKAAWWTPRWLEKLLPNIAIEGKDTSTSKSKK